jgi:hypothetical protein
MTVKWGRLVYDKAWVNDLFDNKLNHELLILQLKYRIMNTI